ncbi:MAG: ABC transporter ATP-binding protein [Phycisphaerales bacterium]|nr:ABC transporter ATP-binding protein [Phycisphaerales bacterium]
MPVPTLTNPVRVQSPSTSPATDPILSARNVFKTYRLDRVEVPVLKGASIEVPAGAWVAILGASGSGKSTLMHLLGGLDRPDRDKGEVHFDGRMLSSMSASELDRYRNVSVGFVFQFYHLLPELSVIENALIPAMVLHGRLGFSRRRAELTAHADALLKSFGLGHRLTHRPAQLSGGERQRVAIARALVNDPPVLLADEPTGNLDRHTGEAILDLITRHRAETGRTLVMVTHDPEVAGRADRIVRLEDGRVAG